MTATHATVTITVPWWAYGAFSASVLGLIAAGYMAGRLDRRDARQVAAINREFAPTIRRWQALDEARTRMDAAGERDHADVEGATAWPINHGRPAWATALEVWGQPRLPAGYPRPPALTPGPDPRTVGHAPVADVAPLDFGEQVSALNVALGGPIRWAADSEETGWIPAVRA
ncbi:hypothetical protein JNW88_00150 [Micromonospora sp. ATA32]|nr:hypothetical protein [Micromonospora sp. ATA32]